MFVMILLEVKVAIVGEGQEKDQDTELMDDFAYKIRHGHDICPRMRDGANGRRGGGGGRGGRLLWKELLVVASTIMLPIDGLGHLVPTRKTLLICPATLHDDETPQDTRRCTRRERAHSTEHASTRHRSDQIRYVGKCIINHY